MKKISKAMAERLGKLGFNKLSQTIEHHVDFKAKLIFAYNHYGYINQAKIDDFNKKLQDNKDSSNSYLQLKFINIKEYENVPPEEVLTALGKAKKDNCFDYFEIAVIEKIKDPILFGRITNNPDRFYIAAWDDDVSLEFLLVCDIKNVKATEGFERNLCK